MPQLALGSAQFGFDYGISNTRGQTVFDEVSCILDTAQKRGISLIDTAALYGDAESVLGHLLDGNNYFNIVTKLPDLNQLSTVDCSIEGRLLKSLKVLNKECLHGVLLHNAANLLSDQSDIFYGELLKLKTEGYVKKIGISSYYPEEVFKIIHRYDVDIVQVPVNILDQRFLDSGCLKELKSRHIEVQVRSLFLQGLLLMDVANIPTYFDDKKEPLLKYFDVINDLKISKIEAALSFIKNCADIDFAIIGVNNNLQLSETIAYWDRELLPFDCAQYACEQEELVIPSHWKL